MVRKQEAQIHYDNFRILVQDAFVENWKLSIIKCLKKKTQRNLNILNGKIYRKLLQLKIQIDFNNVQLSSSLSQYNNDFNTT